MEATRETFLKPTRFERLLNRLVGVLIGLGIGPGDGYLLEVRGRKSGRVYQTPVDLLQVDGRLYLVCPRGRSQWVRNAEAAGRVVLRKGSSRREFIVEPVAQDQKLPLLQQFLDRFKMAVQRYFPVPAGSPPAAFEAYVERYPVFELKEANRKQ